VHGRRSFDLRLFGLVRFAEPWVLSALHSLDGRRCLSSSERIEEHDLAAWLAHRQDFIDSRSASAIRSGTAVPVMC